MLLARVSPITSNLIVSDLLFLAVKQTPSTDTLAPFLRFFPKFLGAVMLIEIISSFSFIDLIDPIPEKI